MRRVFLGLLWAVPGYLVGAFGGGYLVTALSTNGHDRPVEAAMAGAFVWGPAAAVVAFVIGMRRSRPSGEGAHSMERIERSQ